MVVQLAIVVLGCRPRDEADPPGVRPGSDPDRRPTPTDSDPPGGVALALSGVVTCADPGRQAAQRYDTQILTVPGPEEFLIADGGFVLADLDGDDLLDLVVAGTPAATFRGAQGGTAFVASPLGLDGIDLRGMAGGSAVDYDADGDLDLFVARWQQSDLLLRNDGDRFVDITAAAGVQSADLRSVSSAWDDFDGDGWLDLFVGRYGVTPDLDGGEPLRGDGPSLWRSDGHGAFVDRTEGLPAAVRDGYGFMSGWYDLDGDGDRELFVVNDFGDYLPSRVLRNDGGVLVQDDSAGFHPGFDGMGLGVGDVNRDGRPDFLQTSNRAISLLRSVSSPVSTTGVLYVEAAHALGVEIDPGTGSAKGQDWGWGAELADLDNDGDQDGVALYGRWDIYLGNPREHDEVFLWDGETFLEVADRPEWDLDWDASKRGLAVFDLDGNGTLDLIRRALDGTVRIERGRCGAQAWIEVELRDATTANARGIGATITVTAEGETWTEWIGAGSSGMFTGGPPIAHVGLGFADEIDELCVRWPDGADTCVEGLEPRQRVTVYR